MEERWVALNHLSSALVPSLRVRLSGAPMPRSPMWRSSGMTLPMPITREMAEARGETKETPSIDMQLQSYIGQLTNKQRWCLKFVL
eukprot:311159-Pleurochrysis_carterae.AAC.1